MMSRKQISITPVLMMWTCLNLTADPVQAAAPDLTGLSIEELMNVPVVSPTKQAQRLADTASAIL
jgi:hypothetical protein